MINPQRSWFPLKCRSGFYSRKSRKVYCWTILPHDFLFVHCYIWASSSSELFLLFMNYTSITTFVVSFHNRIIKISGIENCQFFILREIFLIFCPYVRSTKRTGKNKSTTELLSELTVWRFQSKQWEKRERVEAPASVANNFNEHTDWNWMRKMLGKSWKTRLRFLIILEKRLERR